VSDDTLVAPVETPREAGVVSEPIPAVAETEPVVEPAVIAPPEAVVVSLTPLQHVEAWWADVKASAPAPTQKAFWLHAEQEWDKLVARLENL
jgi:hypothetical protein